MKVYHLVSVWVPEADKIINKWVASGWDVANITSSGCDNAHVYILFIGNK